MHSYNTFCSPNLNGVSPYEIVSGRKPKLLIDLETYPNVKVSETFKEYYDLLGKRLEYLHKLLFNFKMKKLSTLNKERVFFQYESGDLIAMVIMNKEAFSLRDKIDTCLNIET